MYTNTGLKAQYHRSQPRTKNNKGNFWKKLNVFNRKVSQATASKTIKTGIRSFEGVDLSSRKITLCEKIKHHLNIFSCNLRLTLHLYFDQEGRSALKTSRSQSQAQLDALNSRDNRKNEIKKLQTAVEDGQFADAARSTAKAGRAIAKEGISNMKLLLS